MGEASYVQVPAGQNRIQSHFYNQLILQHNSIISDIAIPLYARLFLAQPLHPSSGTWL
jgi:hypothetical protein